MTTLDGVERALAAGTLLICDGAGPVALAGVMGGLRERGHRHDRRVLIEAAQFDRTSIRVTAIGQRLPSEASLRFGRGVPAAGSLDAARRAAELMRRHAGGSIARGVVDVYPRPQPAPPVRLPAGEIERVLGFVVPAAEVRRILVSLGCTVREEGGRLRRHAAADAPRPRDPRRPGRGGRAHHRLPPHPERADVRRVRAAAAEPGHGRRGPRPRRARRLRPDRGDHLLAHRPGLVHAPRPRGGRQRLRLPRQPDDRRPHAPAPPHPAGAARDAAAQPPVRRPRRDLRAGARLPPLGAAAPRGAAAAGAAAQRRVLAAVVGEPGAAAVRLLPRQGDPRDARRAAQRRAAVVRAVRGLAVPERPRRGRVARRRDGRAPSANSTRRCATSSICPSGGSCSASSTPRRCWPARVSARTAPSRATRR